MSGQGVEVVEVAGEAEGRVRMASVESAASAASAVVGAVAEVAAGVAVLDALSRRIRT